MTTRQRWGMGALTVVGPAAWAGHLLASYALVYVTCQPGLRILLHVVTVVALGAIVASAVVGWRWETTRPREGLDVAEGWGLVRVLGWSLVAFFLLVTAMAGVASMVVSPCL